MSISRRTFFTFYINYFSIAFYALYIIFLVTPRNLYALAYYTILSLNAFVQKPSGRKNERSLPRIPRTNAGECLRRRVSGDIDVVVVGQ